MKMEKDKLKEKNNQLDIDLKVLKIDLDVYRFTKVQRILVERLQFLININLIVMEDIVQIEMVKKQKYSAKIILKKPLKSVELLILFQSILGDDYKRKKLADILKLPATMELEKFIQNNKGLVLFDCAYLVEQGMLPLINYNVIQVQCDEEKRKQI